MSYSVSEKILHFISAAPLSDFNDRAFNEPALELFQDQFEKNAIYRGICRQRDVDLDRVTHWHEIPAVTTSAFKEVALTCFPAHEAIAIFHTSGTTQKRAGKHYFRTLDYYRTAMLRSVAAYCLDQQPSVLLGLNNETLHDPLKDVIPEESFYNSKQSFEMKKDSLACLAPLPALPRPFGGPGAEQASRMTFPKSKMRMFFLGPTSELFPNSSLGYMFSGLRDEFGDEGSAVFFSPQNIEVNGLQMGLQKALQENVPVFILGTALALLEFMERFQQQGRTFQLPAGSRILDTGGYKGRYVEITRQKFQQQLSEIFGVPQEFLLNEYGMTELSSQFYASSLPGIPLRSDQRNDTPFAPHFLPPWARVVAADPENLQILPEGEIGLLRIFDLANVDSVMAIQTEDMGRAWPDRIELFGRATGAELRGCSLLTEAILRSV